MADVPDIRISTAEREHALQELSQHFSAGRLSLAEFDERSIAVAAAVTKADLAPLFADLPSKPAEVVTQPPTPPRGAWDWRAAAIAITPIVALVLFFTLGSWLSFLLIPAVPAVLEAGKRISRGHDGTD